MKHKDPIDALNAFSANLIAGQIERGEMTLAEAAMRYGPREPRRFSAKKVPVAKKRAPYAMPSEFDTDLF